MPVPGYDPTRLPRGGHFRFAFGLGISFQHHLQIRRSRGLQFELQVRHSGSEKVKRNQREDGDAQAAGRGDQRLRDTTGDGLNGQLFVTE